MRKIILFLLVLSSVSLADGFLPSMKVGDYWIVRREISGIDSLEGSDVRTQYWRYEVVSKYELNGEGYAVIFAELKEAGGNFKIVVNSDKFYIKEISFNYKGKVTVVSMEEVSAPVIDVNIFARLYDLPAFPLINPDSASESVEILPDGKKRIRKNFRRKYPARGEVDVTELISQETDNISQKDMAAYGRKKEDYVNRAAGGGYMLNIKGEKKRVKQIWIEDVPWWLYSDSLNERNYLVGFTPAAKK